MYSKQTVHVLFGIISLLSVSFFFFTYTNYKKNDQLTKAISLFNNKLKNDSVFFANSNQHLLDKITHHIIDSLSIVYNNKSISNQNKSKKITLLKINNSTPIVKVKPDIVKSSLKSEGTKIKLPKNSSVITYSQLKNYQIERADNDSYSNVTTYSKIENNITPKTKKRERNTNIPLNKVSSLIKNSITNHNNPILNSALNINDLDKVPVYKGCEHYLTEFNKKKCFKTKIYNHIIHNFNSRNLQDLDLKTESNKIRALLIINKNGYAKMSKLIGKWSKTMKENVKFAIESIPKMIPGYKNNKPTNVKYSILIPL